MKICLLGATGRTGKAVLSQALDRAWEVKALVRDPQKVALQSEKLQLITGNPSNKEDLSKALVDCEAVINTLNISRKSDFPWAKLRTPQRFLSEVASHLIELLPLHEIERIVFTTAWGVGDSLAHIPTWFRLLIQHSNIGYAYLDHERQEALFEASDLAWTAVRPVGLTNSEKHKTLMVSINHSPKPKLMISRTRVAQFLLDCLSDSSYIHEKPVISEK
ncbi:MAG: NAD(P)H-binding protein [Saprospiraceae bacterium]|nr:NAD(P)H-binding protein [Saprospiraceae bacterium]